MANATLTQIREGLAANLAVLDGVQVNPYPLANPTPPCIQILGGDIEYDQAMRRGLDIVQMTVQGIVAHTADIGSQARLDEWVAPTGTGSVKAALEADTTLGGTVANLQVVAALGERAASSPTGGMVLVREWSVDVYASN